MSAADTKALIATAVERLLDAVPALRQLKLVIRLQLEAKGGDAPTFTATIPPSVDLAPGASSTVPVVVHVPANQSATTSTVSVSGTVQSSWGDALKSLGLTFAPTLTASISASSPGAASAPPTPAPAAGLPPYAVPALIAVAALLVLGLLAARLRAPKMVGSMAVSRDGRLVREFLLAGRSTSLADPATPELSGTIGAAKGNGPTVAVDARTAQKQRVKQLLGDTQSVEVGPYRLTYTAQRTRTLSMVRAGLEETEA